MTSLVINNVEIGTDDAGRFSLNDLHKAAGSTVAALPNKFLRQDSVKKVSEILNAQNRAFNAIEVKRGRYTGGTWVCKELVYKYAMWVDAEFEVKVIQTFDSINRAARAPDSMQRLNEIVSKAQKANEEASFYGKGLANHKKVKKQNQKSIAIEVERIQLKLGFSK